LKGKLFELIAAQPVDTLLQSSNDLPSDFHGDPIVDDDESTNVRRLCFISFPFQETGGQGLPA
jgi:hypothetical protein